VLREGELGALLEVRAEVTAVLLGTSILVADTADAALQLPDPPDPATPLPSLPQVLAYTGSDQGMTLLGGFALLVFGLALTLTSRKKKRKDIA
jgi:LPXTG-motif cell wall-anchored protein